MTRQLIFLGFLFTSACLNAQRIAHLSALFTARDSNFVRISYDNDLFLGKDIYYTQGAAIEVYSTGFRKNPVNKLLLDFTNSQKKRYGIQLFSSVYNPTNYITAFSVTGDRPYAGVLGFRFIESSVKNSKKSSLSSTLDLGVIGPYAFGKEIQSGIHSLINNTLPIGWEFQIKNAPIINYGARLERQFYSHSFFTVQGMSHLNLGTFQSNIASGIEFSIGLKNNPYRTEERPFELYLYSQSQLKIVGYDASLMGGIINRDSYHLRYAQISPFVGEQHLGIVFATKHVCIGIDLGFISREIKTGWGHRWGGIRLGFY